MPTPYGSRGGMAFSADELRILRRALAIALRPHSVLRHPGPARAEEVRDCLRLAEAVDEAAHEGDRLRAFLLADLARYRSALPGAAPGYLERLQDALAAGCRPGAEDVAALRTLCAATSGRAEAGRRAALLQRCERLTQAAVPASRTDGAPVARRTRLLALPGGRTAPQEADGPKPGARPAAPERPAEKPAAPPSPPRPDRPIPTPGEVFPPRRKPTPPPTGLTARPA
ncbi:hypothetical protein ACMATS_16875 [Streptoverticillium reticulum]|uniref:hypothetical protein n=1 Tax=Streptoverticillium reticulum TaxID=1433415 RepID=UPI0039BF1691